MSGVGDTQKNGMIAPRHGEANRNKFLQSACLSMTRMAGTQETCHILTQFASFFGGGGGRVVFVFYFLFLLKRVVCFGASRVCVVVSRFCFFSYFFI